MESILQGCIDSRGVMWWANMRKQSWGYMIFIAGNRRYQKHPMDGNDRYEEEAKHRWVDPSLSSTQVRENILCRLRVSKEELQSTVINGDLLAMYTGVYVTWVSDCDWTEYTTATEVIDDFEIGLPVKLISRKRRGSF